MTENYATTGIILAAGSSKRFGQNKLLAQLNDKPVLAYSLEAFENSSFVNSIILVTSESIKKTVATVARNYNITKLKNIVIGGKTRQESVKNALEYLVKHNIKCLYVAIHDGARPLVTSKDIDNCIQGAVKHKATTLGIRPKDTIKQTENPYSKTVKSTTPRELLWVIQTPQAFEFDVIYQAHEAAMKNNFNSTDDCALVEKQGIKPEIIEGSYKNLKITNPEDIDIASVFLNS
ncbi:MAG: 2-C-methyl-D-erythritol 4-phosphate cytidylyltransferase [Cyanobacteriota bacterium]